jgi:hypothetical protein
VVNLKDHSLTPQMRLAARGTGTCATEALERLCLGFSPNGELLAAVSDSPQSLWDLKAGRLCAFLPARECRSAQSSSL